MQINELFHSHVSYQMQTPLQPHMSPLTNELTDLERGGSLDNSFQLLAILQTFQSDAPAFFALKKDSGSD